MYVKGLTFIVQPIIPIFTTTLAHLARYAFSPAFFSRFLPRASRADARQELAGQRCPRADRARGPPPVLIGRGALRRAGHPKPAASELLSRQVYHNHRGRPSTRRAAQGRRDVTGAPR